MRVLIAPDSFGDTLTAVQAAAAIAEGWSTQVSTDTLIQRPMSDGGPGFVDVLDSALDGQLIPVETTDPLGRPTVGAILLGRTGSAYVESAQAAGLHLLAADERDPRVTSSYGVGTLMLAAAEAGARRIYVGLGGSGTNDAGAGMLAAVGVVGRDAAGQPLAPGGLALHSLDHFDGYPLLRTARVVAATDVDNPLVGIRGASAVFGPQKGADPNTVQQLDVALARFAEIAVRDIGPAPDNLARMPGAGAAGGLGAALFALNGTRESGIDVTMNALAFHEAAESVDLVITGEGKLDEQSLRGKVPHGVARAAQGAGVPCIVLAGQVELGRRKAASYGFDAEYSVSDHAGSVQTALAHPVATLVALARQVAREWTH